MFCPKCGNQVSEIARFCPKCGYNIGTGGMVPTSGPAPQSWSVPQTSPIPGTLYEQKLAQATREGLGMNWYKFIIYVQCFVGGIIAIVSGIVQILGLQYGDNARLVYSYYSALKIVDIIYGIFLILFGILMVYTRFGLKGFKAESFGIYIFLPLISVVLTILYNVLVSIIVHTSLFDLDLVSAGTIGAIVGSIALFVANYIYFNNRRHLFTEA